MKKEVCDHIVGLGSSIFICPSPKFIRKSEKPSQNAKGIRWFDFCPECGQQLRKETNDKEN